MCFLGGWEGGSPCPEAQAKDKAVVPSTAWGSQCLPEAAFSEVLFKAEGEGGIASFVLLCPLLVSMHFLLSFGPTELLYFKFCPENDNLDESPTYPSIVACKMLYPLFQLKFRKKPPFRVGNGFETWLPPCGRIVLQPCSGTKTRVSKLGQPGIIQPSRILLVRSCSVIISWGNGGRTNVGFKIDSSR